MKFFKLNQKVFYVGISEGQKGLEFFVDDDIKLLPKPLRKTIITFLAQIIDDLRFDLIDKNDCDKNTKKN